MKGNIYTPKIHDIIIPGCKQANSVESTEIPEKASKSAQFLALKPGKCMVKKLRANGLNEATQRL